MKSGRGNNSTKNEKRGRQARAGREAGSGDEKASVGGGCVGVPGILRGGGYRLGSGPIAFETEETRYQSWL